METQVGMWPRRRKAQRSFLPQVLELVAIIACIVGGYHGLLWYWEYTAPREVKVPELVGMTGLEATKSLTAVGLRSEVVSQKTDEEVPDGAVLSSEPPSGRPVKEGRLVRLTLSSGSKWAVVPDVREMSVDRARALLRQEHLTIGKETARYHEKVPVGYVIGHAPSPEQKVPRRTPVDLVVSKGPAPQIEPVDVGAGLRRTKIVYQVPPGASLQEVRIVVRDSDGERTVYREFHRPVEQVEKMVSARGPGAVVQVYLSGLVVQERPL